MPNIKKAPKDSRSKGRPRCFDRDKALFAALEVFWQRGYEPASISELCKVMGINAPSLYATFGNKAKLFLEAATFYEETYWDAPGKKLMAEPDIYKAIGDFFAESARILLSPDTPCGCMVVLAAVNISDDAKEITDAIRQLRFATKDLFATKIRQGIEDGQLPQDTDVASMAGAFNTMLEGLSIQARDGLSQSDLERVAQYAIRILPNKKQAD